MFKNTDINYIYCYGHKHRSIKTWMERTSIYLPCNSGYPWERREVNGRCTKGCSSVSKKLYSLSLKKEGRKEGEREEKEKEVPFVKSSTQGLIMALCILSTPLK